MQDKNYFEILNDIVGKVEEKNGMNYISWSDAWTDVKKNHPEANYTIYENAEGFPFWESKFGIDVKVGVTINNIEHIVRLPVMDGANKSMKFESYTYKTKFGEKTCEGATQFDINKAIQRAFAKAIAMHGIGLYVYRGEDFPDEIDGSNKNVTKKEKPYVGNQPTKSDILLMDIKSAGNIETLLSFKDDIEKVCVSEKQKEFFRKQANERYKELNKAEGEDLSVQKF